MNKLGEAMVAASGAIGRVAESSSLEEREAAVKWLRLQAERYGALRYENRQAVYAEVADLVEAGEHRKEA